MSEVPRFLELTLPPVTLPAAAGWEQLGSVDDQEVRRDAIEIKASEVQDNDGGAIVTTEEYLLVLRGAEACLVTRWRVQPTGGLLCWHDGEEWVNVHGATARFVDTPMRMP